MTQPHYIDRGLLPCPNPWCGSGVQPMSFAMRGGFRQVICGCGFKGPRKATKEESEAAWNRRPASLEAVAWREAVAEIVANGLAEFDGRARPSYSNRAIQTAAFAENIAARVVQALAVIPTQDLGSSLRDTHCVAETAVVANSGGAQLRGETCWTGELDGYRIISSDPHTNLRGKPMTPTTKTVFRLAHPHPWQIQLLVPHEGEAYLLLTADGVGEFSAPVPADKVDLVCQLIKAGGAAWEARDKPATQAEEQSSGNTGELNTEGKPNDRP